jgi:excisionase family DNA binding protein
MKEIENWLSPSEAGRLLGTSGQWVTQLARAGKLDGVRTSLGWLVNPEDVDRLAEERTKAAEKKLSEMKAARSIGPARARRTGRRGAGLGGSVNG